MALAVSATGALVVGAESEAAPVTRGASVPFTTIEAEDAAHNGSVIGPDLTQGSLPSEASGRRAVTITSGQYVDWTLTGAANAVNVHYSVPDGRQGTLSVYVNGTKLDRRLNTTSQYSYIETPWIPGARDLTAGSKVRVQVDSGDDAGQYTIDLADFEQVAAPAEQPSGSVPVTDHGAVPNDGQDDVAGFRAAIDAAKAAGAEVWIPRGEFDLGSSLRIDQVTIRGAGAWYSVLRSNNPFNNDGVSGGIELRDFAVMGAVTERNDSAPDNGSTARSAPVLWCRGFRRCRHRFGDRRQLPAQHR